MSFFDFFVMEATQKHFSEQVTEARQVFLGIPNKETQDLEIVSLGFEKCLPEFLMERDSYPVIGKKTSKKHFTTLEIITGGKGELVLHKEKHKLGAGSFFSYGVGTYHRISSSTTHPLVKYFLVLAHESNSVPIKQISKKPFFSKIRNLGEIIELFELLLSNANSGSHYSLTVCNHLANALVLKISELMEYSEQKQVRAWDTYNRILQHVRNNYFRLRTIDELATEVNIDAAYLSRVFKRFHKESPYRFLIRLKMGHAASILLSTRRLVKDIAFELGYENQFHFSRTFKSVYGVSPENFLQTND